MQKKSNPFEIALLDYGSQVMAIIFQYALETERYEDCATIRDLFTKYHLDLEQSMEDYQAHFWKLGYSGRTAIFNINEYINDALKLIGYPENSIRVKPQFI